ncbi:hypothetical protein FOYG_15744 [Fusarium oxysporum NRRL 32931]|uniref:Transmembrane protein 53-B n=1 Tax=Fusarium oxysporum NRRL 32931 TaxID=660029 RepID=W9HKL0_FUSOX|nr:hypothetical protein FOYG_15744 [Fusarium oxysporum NRRL 32931]
MPDTLPSITRLSSQVFVQDAEESAHALYLGHPRVVIIYGWGDGSLKHVLKYLYGYRQLYQHAKIIIVLSPMILAMRQNAAQRAKDMLPVIEAAFSGHIEKVFVDSVLVHVMSGTGAINYAATLNAYQQKYGCPLPHRMTAYDSTAGGSDFNAKVLFQWSYALALGTRAWLPCPFFLIQLFWAIFIFTGHVSNLIQGKKSLGAISERIMLDETYKSKVVRNLYLYSKEDRLVSWMDIENGMAEAKIMGYTSGGVIFQSSGHVSHMRAHPKLYWGSIEKSWDRAIPTVRIRLRC